MISVKTVPILACIAMSQITNWTWQFNNNNNAIVWDGYSCWCSICCLYSFVCGHLVVFDPSNVNQMVINLCLWCVYVCDVQFFPLTDYKWYQRHSFFDSNCNCRRELESNNHGGLWLFSKFPASKLCCHPKFL